MTSEIHWINHAGYELRTGGLRIVHDPWLFGLAFDNGWALVADSVYKPEDFAGVDYIWFSHEHPDHFSPAVVKSIPEPIRKTITVLFQRTQDRRVAAFCEKAGFKLLELEDGVRTRLNDRVTVTCGQVIGRDSWFFVQSDDIAVFNANDCVGVDWSQIAARLGQPVDVLLTQFSFANWVGNPGEHERMQAAAKQKFSEVDTQVKAFAPRYVVPFASYVWFCRSENFHMNEHANRISDVAQEIGKTVPVVVLYPGDTYSVGTSPDNDHAIERYADDWNRRCQPLAMEDPEISIDELTELAATEQRRLNDNNMLWILKPLAWMGFIKPVYIYLNDIEEGLVYSIFGGILQTGLRREECELVMGSSSFALMVKTGYGYGTLAINGRYLETVPGAMGRLSRHFAIAARNEEGTSVPDMFLRSDYVFYQIKKAARRFA